MWLTVLCGGGCPVPCGMFRSISGLYLHLIHTGRTLLSKSIDDELPRSVGAQYATGEEWRNSSRKNEEAESRWKQRPAVDVSGDASKVWCCKEEYCIGTWNVRSMNQAKLDVVKQEMARVNIDILEISELKWTWMGEFNSDDHYIYYCGQESLKKWNSCHS